MSSSNPICSICSLEMLSDQPLRMLCPETDSLVNAVVLGSAKHIFHSTCVDSWIGSHHSCPLCRREISVLPHEMDLRSLYNLGEFGLVQAATLSHLGALCRILDIESEFLSKESYNKAFFAAVKQNHLTIVKEFLDRDLISRNDKCQAMMLAASLGFIETTSLLIGEDHIFRRIALNHAVGYNKCDLATSLFPKEGPIESHYFNSLIIISIEGKGLEILSILLSRSEVTSFSRGIALIHSVIEGHVEMVNFVLSKGDISDDDRRIAITNVKPERTDILAALTSTSL